MKIKLLAITALVILALTITSCYSSRRSKTGCPTNVGAIAKPEVTKQAA